MNQNTDYTPAALYARVSSDHQDVDLSVAAQLRALRDYAAMNGYLVAREYIDEAAKPTGPFREILVWKFSRFTRKREHADGQANGGHHRERGRVLLENLAQEVTRGMREAASRGFWIGSRTPYGYNRIMVQDGAKKRPTLEPDPDSSRVVKRIFDIAEAGTGMLHIAGTLNDEGIATPAGKLWSKNSIHFILRNEVYTGTLIWGANAKDKADPVRIEKAFPAIISKAKSSASTG